MTSIRIAKFVNLLALAVALAGMLTLVVSDQLMLARGFRAFSRTEPDAFGPGGPAMVFFHALLFSLVGASVGGHVGAIAEENPSGELDLGVTSAVGAFVLGLSATAFGATLAGLDFTRAIETSVLIVLAVLMTHLLGGGAVRLQRDPTLETENERAAAGKPVPRIRQRDKITIVLGLTCLFLVMQAAFGLIALYGKTQSVVQSILHQVLYAVMGAAAGGMIGGWTSGLSDAHHGRPETDNPILVAGLGMIAGLTGSVLGALVGAIAGGAASLPGGATVSMSALAGSMVIGAFFFLTVALRRITFLPKPSAASDEAPVAEEPRMNRTITLDESERVRYGETLQVRVEGIVSSISVRQIEMGLGRTPGVVTVTVDASRGTVTATYDHQQITRGEVMQKLVDLGFAVIG